MAKMDWLDRKLKENAEKPRPRRMLIDILSEVPARRDPIFRVRSSTGFTLRGTRKQE